LEHFLRGYEALWNKICISP